MSTNVSIDCRNGRQSLGEDNHGSIFLAARADTNSAESLGDALAQSQHHLTEEIRRRMQEKTQTQTDSNPKTVKEEQLSLLSQSEHWIVGFGRGCPNAGPLV